MPERPRMERPMCNSDRRHFLRMSVVVLGVGGIAGAALAAETDRGKPKVYICPPCGCDADGKEFPAPGQCPECGMPLIEKPAAPPKLSAQDRDVGAWRAPAAVADARPARGAQARAALRLTT